MPSTIRTARWTGVAYLALAVFGMLGFLVVRPRLRVEGDPAASLSLLVEHSALASAAIILELLIVLAQALTAVGFFAVIRPDRPVAAFGVAVFGMANAAALLGSAATLVVATRSARGGATEAVGVLLELSDAFWAVGGVFFGLWLIPMGWFVLSAGRMPQMLGWVLVVGGVGYVLDAVISTAIPAVPTWFSDVAVIPATIGELWMVGYLLVRGVRR